MTPDHELQSEYNFTVIATDSEGNTSSESASISIVDVDDANPVINDDTSVSITRVSMTELLFTPQMVMIIQMMNNQLLHMRLR